MTRRLPPHPALDWSAEGTPEASAFGDVYFSKAGGLAEAEAVFLGGCGLPDAWKCKDRFAVCELGFGTGLNVLGLWNAWKKTRLPHAQLHISTIEAFPLARTDAARALAHFPGIEGLSAQLLARWPVRAYAPQRIWFPEDGLSLTVFVGEAETILPQLEGQFDAWFLDGFAPARNPAMWSETIFAEMARLSAPGARAATFTVAGDVRRGLQAAGFAVEKKPGFGSKRERLESVFQDVAPEQKRASHAGEGARAPRTAFYPYQSCNPKRVAVIGAGIAGAACAQALTRRGVETIVVEAARDLGAGASGNPAGLVMPRFDRGGGALGTLFLAAYLDAIATYEALGVFDACGVEQRPQDERDAAALADLIADPPLPEDWFAALDSGALHARAGLVRPRAAIEAMLRGAAVLYETEVRSLDAAYGGGWVLRGEGKRALLKADAVVLACGAALKQFEPAAFLPITVSRGQIEWGAGRAPPHAITSGAYVAPFEGGVLFGATFDNLPQGAALGEEPTEEARARNLAALAQIAPDVAASVTASARSSRVSYRATTPDRAPIAGLLPDAPAWLAQYEDLAHGRAINATAEPPAHAGVYVLGGLGARGLTLAPLLGERIAAEMCGDIMPLPKNSLDAIHPARFLHRALKRR